MNVSDENFADESPYIADALSRIQTSLKSSVWWALANAFGIWVIFRFDPSIFAPASEEEAFRTIDAFNFWLVIELPVLTVFLILNLIWLSRLTKTKTPDKRWQLTAWLLICLSWGGTVFIHGITPACIAFCLRLVFG